MELGALLYLILKYLGIPNNYFKGKMHLPLSEHLVAQPRPSRVMIKQNFLL
jgi:hypothetical protein